MCEVCAKWLTKSERMFQMEDDVDGEWVVIFLVYFSKVETDVWSMEAERALICLLVGACSLCTLLFGLQVVVLIRTAI